MSLIAWYKLDGNALDSSGNGRDGSISGATSTTAGKIGGCYSFDGVNNYIQTGDFPASSGYSIALWFNAASASGDPRLYWGNSSDNAILYINSALKLVFYCKSSGGVTGYNTSASAISLNVWNHVVLTYNGTTANLYINGVYDRSATSASGSISAFRLNLGTGYNRSSYYYSGKIDDVRIYNHALSEKEVKELAKAKVLHYTFDEFQEPTVNLAPYTDYSNRTYNNAYTASSWGGDAATITYYSSGGYNDLPYKKMVKTAGGDGGSYLDDNTGITIEDNKVYTVSMYMKADRAGISGLSGYATCINRPSDNAYRTGITPTLTTEWQRFSWVYTTTTGHAGTYCSRHIIYVDSGLPIEIYWCGFQVEEKDHATPFVNGTRTGSVSDNSGYDNHADLALATTPRWITDSRIGKGAYYFDGNTYFYANPYPKSTDTVSLSFWASLANWQATSDQRFISCTEGGGINAFVSGSVFQVDWYIGGSYVSPYFDKTSLTAGWHHFVITYNGSAIKIYCDGIEKTSVARTGVITYPKNKLYFGGENNNDTDPPVNRFTGFLDDVRIYATALSADDVRELYNVRAQIDNKGNFFVNNIQEIEESNKNNISEKGVANMFEISELGPTNGLVAYYPLNGDAKDYANANDGTVNGAIISAGINGKACYSFDGVDDYIDCGDFIDYSNGFTLSSWINPDTYGTSNYGRIADKTINTGTSTGFFLYMPTAPTLQFTVNNTGGITASANSTPYGSWTHVVAQVDSSGNCKIYINGVLNVSGTTGAPSGITATTPLTIGNRSGAIDRAFDGLIQNVRIYNRALSQEEITILYDLERGDTIKAKMNKNTLYVGGQIHEG